MKLGLVAQTLHQARGMRLVSVYYYLASVYGHLASVFEHIVSGHLSDPTTLQTRPPVQHEHNCNGDRTHTQSESRHTEYLVAWML